MTKRLIAECLGTFWLVLGGCGAAVFAAGFPGVGIGFAGVALAFGLTVLTMAFAIGHISGCHLNPAVTVGLTVARRFPLNEAIPYIVVQVVGAAIGAGCVYLIADGAAGFDVVKNGLATNGYGDRSPGHYSLFSCFVCEVVMTFMFLVIILGATVNARRRDLAPTRHRPWSHADPSDQHSDHQHLRKPCAQHRSRLVRGRRRPATALAVLGGTADRWRARRYRLPRNRRRSGVAAI